MLFFNFRVKNNIFLYSILFLSKSLKLIQLYNKINLFHSKIYKKNLEYHWRYHKNISIVKTLSKYETIILKYN